MPYIKKEKRDAIWPCNIPGDNAIDVEEINCAGDLNYAFTVLIHNYFCRKGLNYQNINDAIGALEGAKLELYRRTAAPYEDMKIAENGDVP
jgi:hypothetical protein